MGNEAEQHTNSDGPEKKSDGVKHPVDGAAAVSADSRDNVRVAGGQPSPSPVGDFMRWGNWPTPNPGVQVFGNRGGMENGSAGPQCLASPFWYPGVTQHLSQMPSPIFPLLPSEDQQNAGPGQYSSHGLIAVPLIPIFGPMTMLSPASSVLPVMLPLPMCAPLRMEGLAQLPVQAGVSMPERMPQGEVGDTRGPLGPPWGGAQALQRPIEPQRQAIRRFRVGFQLDLLLLLKLAVVVFVFNQDGSKDRLFVLLLLAAIVYMYQTGALAPLLRWFSQLAQRAMTPPQQPDHGNMPEGQAAVPGGAAMGGHEPNEGANPRLAPPHGLNINNNMQQQRAQPPDADNWWGLFKEVQMLIVGFVTSLLPGYQHAE